MTRRRPITEDKPKSVAADAVQDLAVEILDRAPIYRDRAAEFYYAGNRYVPGVAQPQSPSLIETVYAQGEEA